MKSKMGVCEIEVSSLLLKFQTILLDVAKVNNALDATTADIEEIFSNLGVFEFFNKPTVDTEKKQKVIEEVMSGGEGGGDGGFEL
ncbi:ATP synthase delta chain, chloroplastic-like [Senna tora]|uniref:ATP synthase delta chain, chloroplastic-like n=1 Tax=Senna tora TaxID=362788 RepID=A0A834STE8_9FABA|nr:ATP synthase delta chain, chloroplastic-like [Senna tora]